MKEPDVLNRMAGQFVKEQRLKKSWSQERLAIATDLKRTTISNIEAGRQTLSLVQFCALMQVMRKDPGEALGAILRMQGSKTRDEKVKTVVASNANESTIRKHVLDALITKKG